MRKDNILTSCAFTRHRPTRLAFKFDETHPACIELKHVIKKQVVRLYNRGVRKFYTGCALGVDMWAGEIVLALKARYPMWNCSVLYHLGDMRQIEIRNNKEDTMNY